jgi:hypothetical protein
MIGEEIDAFIASDEKKEDVSKAGMFAAVDNSGKKVAYDELYMVNLSGIELIAEDEERYIETAKLYENWAKTVKEDREIQQNDLAYTKDKKDKLILEERVKVLGNKEVELQAKSTEFRQLASASPELAVNNPIENPNLKAADLKDENQVPEKTEIKKDESLAETGQEKTDVSEDEKKVGKENPDRGQPSASESKAKSVDGIMAASMVAGGATKQTLSDINASYKKAISEARTSSDEPSANLTLAAFELSWAKSIDDLIKEKEAEMVGKEDQADWVSLQKSLDELKAERDKHMLAASSEFTQVEMAGRMDNIPVDMESSKYYIAFDPNDPENNDYNAQYQQLVDAVLNHQILTPDQKNKELSLIHNYWSKTIQDEILWQEEDKTKLKSRAEIQEIENKVLDLTTDKKKHIALSNEYFEKYKASQLFIADITRKEKSKIAEVKPIAKSEANTFGEYAAVYSQYKEEQEKKVQKMQSDMTQVKAKGEKQQLALSLALMERQLQDEALAVEELTTKPEVNLISEEAQTELNADTQNWQEEAEDYVFTKKNFTEGVPENSQAYEQYKEAQQAYNEVQYLESQKAGLMSTSIVNKKAEADLLELETQIEAKKLEAYKALAEASNKEYAINKQEIDRLLQQNPGLEKSDPKLWRDAQAADVIYQEVLKYQKNAEGFKSNSLKFDIYDQAQFMSEYVLTEQQAIITGLKGAVYSGDLAFLASADVASEKLQKQVEEFRINRSEMEAIIENPTYKEYEKDRKALEDIRKERVTLETEVLTEEKALQSIIDERNLIVKEAAGQKKGKKKKLMKEAEVLDQQIAKQQHKLDSVTLVMVQLKEQENNIQRNSARLLKTASVEDRYKMVMLAELRMKGADEVAFVSEVPTLPEKEIVEPADETANVAYSTTLDSDDFSKLNIEIPKELDEDLFITATASTVSPYNANKPIPVDVEIPKGLIFKVQVGAFRNPIPQDLFKGFAPLMGERLDNGITRYTAGLFRDFGNANKAKNEIRKLGYDDAFVVAFMDGVRISFQELRNLENIDLTIPPSVADNTINGVPKEVFTTPSIIDDAGEVSSAIAELTTNTAEVKGIFFSVQVGVYTNTLVPERLKAFRELNSELLPNGNIRYSVGQFKSFADAQTRRADVQSQVSDAFITAYENGIRISVGEAARKLSQSGQ